MMNIKKTLRASRNTALLMAATTGLAYLTACSSDVNIDAEQNVPESTQSGSYSVFGANQSRVHNYGDAATRAAVNNFSMPAEPTIPADAKDLNYADEWGNKPNLNYGTPATGGVYYVKANETLNSGLKLTGITVYVAGTLNMDYMNASGTNTIYVLSSGNLILPSTINPGVTIYNYGVVKDAAGGVTIGDNAKLYSAVDIDCNTFGVNTEAELFCKGSITAESVRLNGKSIACAFIATNDLTLNDNANISTSYLKAAKLTLNASSVTLDNNGLVVADQLFISNQDTRFTVEEGGTNAVVAAPELITNNKDWPKDIFASNIACKFDKCLIGNEYYSTEVAVNELGLQTCDENQVVYVPSTGCHPAYGEKPSSEDPGDEEDEEDITTTEIIKVTEIDPLDDEINHGDHDHGIISATCINFGADGTAYASYHLRGQGSKGCIEVIKDNGSGLALGSYMIAPEYDFNHIIVDGDRIVTVGNNTTESNGGLGAFVAALPTSFAAAENTTDEFVVNELTTDEVIYAQSEKDENQQIKAGYKNAGDGNCIIKYGDNFYVTAYKGYGVLNNNLKKVAGTFVNTSGSCKHIAVGNGKTAVLALDSYDKTSSSASIYTFNLPNGTFGDVLASYDAVGTVAPVDGKNVVAIDGDDIYACLSKGGLARINGGNVETKKFGTNGNVPVNGLAIDEKYLYVAAGSFVYVLDKASMDEVCHYHAESQKSANYIALNNGKIYVAYGEDGIMAFQVVEKVIEK